MRAALLLLSLLVVIQADADETIRCGSHIVNSSMSPGEILAKCGEPTSREVQEVDVRAPTGNGGTYKVGTTTIEIWTYDRGSRAAPIRIEIDGDKVRSIKRIY